MQNPSSGRKEVSTRVARFSANGDMPYKQHAAYEIASNANRTTLAFSELMLSP
jgi:hypothetical protein